MKRGHITLAAVAFVAMTATACSDDDGDDEITIPDLSNVTVPSLPDLTTPDVSLPGDLTLPSLPDLSMPDLTVEEAVEDVIRETFPDLTDAQVECVVETVGGAELSADTLSTIAEECDIDIQDLIPG